MNVELLHALAGAVHEDLTKTKSVELLTQLSDALKSQVEQAQQPEPQERVSLVLSELETALRASVTNAFTPSWRSLLEDLGIDELVGQNLLDRIHEVFRRNQITVAQARDDVGKIRQQVDVLQESLVFLLDGLNHFEIGKLELDAGEFEIGLTVPRRAVDNELGELGSELRSFERLLLPFAEVATGQRPSFRVKNLSSSDFGVLLDSPGAIAAVIAIAIERLTAWYRQLLEIRMLRQGLADQGVTDEELEAVDTHADTHMARGIDEVLDELFAEFGDLVDNERRNELRAELRFALNGLANRIDDGYHVDVRSGPADEQEADENEQDPTDSAGYARRIQELREGLQFIPLDGNPILSLPEPTRDGPNEGGTDGAAPGSNDETG